MKTKGEVIFWVIVGLLGAALFAGLIFLGLVP